MNRKIFGIVILGVSLTLLGLSICNASDVKVMYAIGLLDYGDNAKLLTADEFNQTVADYERFKDRVAKAPTLRAMAQNGWTIVHVETIRTGGADPYKDLNHLLIFQGSRH